MPFYKKINITPTTSVYLWKISETYEYLINQVQLNENSTSRLEKIRTLSHKKAFLSVRMLLKYCGYTDLNLHYDLSGKPSLKLKPNTHTTATPYISISHSGDFAAIAISQEPVGIDIELNKEKILRIAPRFMNIKHLDKINKEEQIIKATVIWGIKEAVFKIENQPGISFPEHITESDFTVAQQKCTAQLIFNHQTKKYNIHFTNLNHYTLVCAISQENL